MVWQIRPKASRIVCDGPFTGFARSGSGFQGEHHDIDDLAKQDVMRGSGQKLELQRGELPAGTFGPGEAVP